MYNLVEIYHNYVISKKQQPIQFVSNQIGPCTIIWLGRSKGGSSNELIMFNDIR